MNSTNVARGALLLGLSFGLSGCGSILNLACDNKPYGGVASDLDDLSPKRGGDSSIGGKVFGVVDLPFSFVVDTVTLPYTLPSHYFFDVGRTCRWASF